MVQTSPHLEEKLTNKNATCNMQIVFVDIVSYSKRKAHAQVKVINAFMKIMERALEETAEQYVKYMTKNRLDLRRDVVILPAGDGAAIGFPFDGIQEMHLSFARHLFGIVDRFNNRSKCDLFRANGWCDCHGAFLLRCGISEGKLILYKDLNDNYNIAGEAVNMAARVMGLAGGGQVFLTERGYSELADLVQGVEERFRCYAGVVIKHALQINVYQYIQGGQRGIDVSRREDLESSELVLKSRISDAAQSVENALEETAAPKTPYIRRSSKSAPSSAAATSAELIREMQGRMVEIPSGEFFMGNDQTGRVLVRFPRSLFVDRYPITQSLYERIMKINRSRFNGAERPAEKVSWNDAIAFCNALSVYSDLDPVYSTTGDEVSIDIENDGYRLLTEAEWEYACLGGIEQERYGPIDRIAWYNKNSDGQTQPVGKKDPNEFGLYDMLGNVWEWCNDGFERRHPPNYEAGYLGPRSSLEHVVRGGSWKDLSNNITAKSRFRWQPIIREETLGFRVARRGHA